jgi:hypothetical protein
LRANGIEREAIALDHEGKDRWVDALAVTTSQLTLTDLSAPTVTAAKRLSRAKAAAATESKGFSGWKFALNCNDWQAPWVISLQS